MMTMSLGDQIYTHPRENIPIDIKSLKWGKIEAHRGIMKGEFNNVF